MSDPTPIDECLSAQRVWAFKLQGIELDEQELAHVERCVRCMAVVGAVLEAEPPAVSAESVPAPLPSPLPTRRDWMRYAGVLGGGMMLGCLIAFLLPASSGVGDRGGGRDGVDAVELTLWNGDHSGPRLETDRDANTERLAIVVSSREADVLLLRVNRRGVEVETEWAGLEGGRPFVLSLSPPTDGVRFEGFVAVVLSAGNRPRDGERTELRDRARALMQKEAVDLVGASTERLLTTATERLQERFAELDGPLGGATVVAGTWTVN